MKKNNLLKIAAISFFSAGLMVGCASDTTEEPAPATETAQECPNAAAKNAIYTAKIKLARAEKLGYAWRDTAKLIADAEKAGKECDNDKAVELARQAAKQSEDAIAQYHAEQQRYAEQKGATEMGTGAGEYTVVSGDNLWNISGKDEIYGNPYQWPVIYKANSDQINDADLIFPGQVFAIPSPTSAEAAAAIEHAKTRGAWTIGGVEQSDRDYLAQ